QCRFFHEVHSETGVILRAADYLGPSTVVKVWLPDSSCFRPGTWLHCYIAESEQAPRRAQFQFPPIPAHPRIQGWRRGHGMSLETVNQLFYSCIDRYSARVMLKREAIDWLPISAGELYRDVVGVARALESWGITKGDRVAILSENRAEWQMADFASLLLRAV